MKVYLSAEPDGGKLLLGLGGELLLSVSLCTALLFQCLSLLLTNMSIWHSMAWHGMAEHGNAGFRNSYITTTNQIVMTQMPENQHYHHLERVKSSFFRVHEKYMFVDVRNTIDEHCVTEERHGLVMS